ncbi:MAG: hypothetical protein ACYC36_03535 [Bellilinea sp.]
MEQDQGTQQGGQEGGAAPIIKVTPVDPTEARSYISNYVPDPKALESMADTDVVSYYDRVKQTNSKFVDDAIAEKTGKWRQEIAGDNHEALKTLERFNSPKALWESYTALRQKVSSGELKASTPFPDKGTPEQQAEWRAEQGLPSKPEEYALKLPEGLVIGDADKPVVDGYLKAALDANIPADQVSASLAWYFEERERKMEEQSAADAALRKESEDALRGEWGTDYRANLNRIDGVLSIAPEGFKERFMGARLADGKALGNDPDALRFLADLARQLNPTSTLVPGDQGQQLTNIESEISKIEATMRTNRKAYNADEKMQSRYRDLLDAKNRMGGQKAA